MTKRARGGESFRSHFGPGLEFYFIEHGIIFTIRPWLIHGK
jgi:hypothetical protein